MIYGDKETDDNAVLSACEAGSSRRIVPGSWRDRRVLFGDRLVVEIWAVKRGEELNSEE